MVNNGFGAERFVASLLALTSFGSHNKRVSGSGCQPSPKSPSVTSDTRQPLGEIRLGGCKNLNRKRPMRKEKEVGALLEEFRGMLKW